MDDSWANNYFALDFQRSRFNRALTSVRLALDNYRHLVTTQHTFIHLRQRASDLLMVCTPGGSIFVSLPLKLVPGCASGSRNLAPHVSGQERGWFRLMESSFEALSSVDACQQFRLVSSSINYQKKTGEKIIHSYESILLMSKKYLISTECIYPYISHEEERGSNRF